MKFEKVSLSQYLEDIQGDSYHSQGVEYPLTDFISGKVSHSSGFTTFKDMDVEEVYHSLKLPSRATKKSAGYDFYAPYDFTLAPGDTIKLATGIKVHLEDDKFLFCAPRSGHGFKARIQLDNTVGIIDADYIESDNEGHIHVKLTNDSRTGKHIKVNRGDGMMQAIILRYFITEDDCSDSQRNGGFGSTDIKEEISHE